MYRTIDASFWTDPKVRKLLPSGRLLLLYLITNPHTHVSGIYYLSRSTILHETGLTNGVLDTLSDTLSSLGFCRFDPETETVWVKNMMRYQGTGDKNARSAALHVTKDLHKSALIGEFLAAYPDVKALVPDTLSIPYAVGATPNPIPDSPFLNTEHREQNTDSLAISSPAVPKYDPGFELFWRTSTKRGSKIEAYREWKKFRPSGELNADMSRGMTAWMASEQWQDETKQPHICRWLKRRGWEEIVPKSNGSRANGNGYHPPTPEEIEAATAELRKQGAIR